MGLQVKTFVRIEVHVEYVCTDSGSEQCSGSQTMQKISCNVRPTQVTQQLKYLGSAI